MALRLRSGENPGPMTVMEFIERARRMWMAECEYDDGRRTADDRRRTNDDGLKVLFILRRSSFVCCP